MELFIHMQGPRELNMWGTVQDLLQVVKQEISAVNAGIVNIRREMVALQAAQSAEMGQSLGTIRDRLT